MHLGEAEATIKDAVALVPRLLEIVPLTPAFPLAYASAAEVLLMSLENNQVLEVERTVKERLVECLVNFFKTSSARIGVTVIITLVYSKDNSIHISLHRSVQTF